MIRRISGLALIMGSQNSRQVEEHSISRMIHRTITASIITQFFPSNRINRVNYGLVLWVASAVTTPSKISSPTILIRWYTPSPLMARVSFGLEPAVTAWRNSIPRLSNSLTIQMNPEPILVSLTIQCLRFTLMINTTCGLAPLRGVCVSLTRGLKKQPVICMTRIALNRSATIPYWISLEQTRIRCGLPQQEG